MKRWVEINGATTDYFVGAELSQYLQEDTIVLLVDTSVQRTIHLPKISELTNISVKIIVADSSGNANSNPIIIVPAGAPDVINGYSQVTISASYGSTQITSAGKNYWLSSFANGQTNPSGGGGGGIQLLEFDITVPFARVQQLLNDSSQFETVIPAPAPNQTIELITANMGVDSYGGIQYDGNVPKLILCSFVQDIKSLIFSTKGDDITANFGVLPQPFYLIMTRKYTDVTYVGNNPFQWNQNGIFLRGYDNNANVTVGNTNLRFFGLYRLKTY